MNNNLIEYTLQIYLNKLIRNWAGVEIEVSIIIETQIASLDQIILNANMKKMIEFWRRWRHAQFNPESNVSAGKAAPQ